MVNVNSDKWTEYELGELLSYEQPTSYIVESTDYDEKYDIPVLTAGKSFLLGYTDEKQGIYDRLPVIIFDDFTTASQYVNFKFKVKSSAMKILQPNTELVLSKFIYYRMQIIQFDHSTHKRYWIQQYSKIRVSVPSLEVQKRIVEKIEEMLSQLDDGVETLNKTKEQLKVYRQAVLRNAFKEQNNTVDMEKIATMLDPHPSHRTPPEVDGGIPYIGIGDIDYDTKIINFDSARKVSIDVAKEHSERYTLQEGDFVMGKIGTIGKPFKLPLPQNYTLSANVILIQPNLEFVLPEFLFWQFTSPYITQQLMQGATATSQPAFGIKKARKLQIKICDKKTQCEILKDIQAKMSICDNIESTVNKTMIQVDALRQSILKKAFEGGL